MIDTYDALYEIIERDPGIDPEVFWPRVGIRIEAIYKMGTVAASRYGIEFATAMSLMEIGATLVEETLKERRQP